MNELVTIVIDTYNQENIVEYTIRSAIAQTYKNIELIVTDDASTDGTVDVIKRMEPELKKRFSNVRIIIHETNVGVTKNVKGALSYARGTWVKQLDGDDMLVPTCIEDNMRLVTSDPSIGMIHSAYYSCYEDTTYESFIKNPGEIKKPRRTEVTTQSLFEDCYIIVPTAFTKTNLYNDAMDENIGIEDWGTFLEISLSKKIAYLDRPTVAYRIVKNSQSRFTNDIKGRDRFRRIIKSEIQILDKYKNHNLINPKRGIQNCCNQAVSIAIDIHDNETINQMKKYARENNTGISLNIKLKLIASKIGVLRIIQKFKKKLGMNTNSVYE